MSRPRSRPQVFRSVSVLPEFQDGRWHGGLLARHHLLALLADFGLALLAVLAPFRLVQWRFSKKTGAAKSRASVVGEAQL